MDDTTRRKIVNREYSFGSWIQIGHPVVPEIMGQSSFDWLAVDMEHTDISLDGFSNLARGLTGDAPAPFARVRENDTLAIRQVLDAGAVGVFVPLVNSAEEAARAVAAARFPPEGIRGFAYCRANDHGADFDEYAATANRSISVIVMIETRSAVTNIDSILGVDGVDGIFIGPYDLSGSYGVVGRTSHPTVVDALERVVNAARRHGKAAGIHVVRPTPDTVQRAIDQGFTLIGLGMDTVFLAESAAASYAEASAIVERLGS